MKKAVFKKGTCLAISILIALPSFAQEGLPDPVKLKDRSLSEILKEQSEDPVCTIDYVPLNDLTDLAITCWDNKKSKLTHPELTDRQLLESDKKICSCLGESPNVHVKNMMNKSGYRSIASATDEAVKNFKDHMELSQKRLQDIQNGMMFQASILSGSDKTFTEAYSQGQVQKLLVRTSWQGTLLLCQERFEEGRRNALTCRRLH